MLRYDHRECALFLAGHGDTLGSEHILGGSTSPVCALALSVLA